jgi:Flp pilus assembly protein TadG
MCKEKKPHFIKRFWQDDRGVVAILFAFFLLIFMGIIALSLDLGRGMMVSAAINTAADAAAIAGAVEDGDKAEALEYFSANLSSGDYGTTFSLGDVEINVNDTDGITVEPKNVSINSYFTGSVSGSGNGAKGSNLNIAGATTVGLSRTQITPSDIILILDASGSMRGSKVSSLNSALREMLLDLDEQNKKLPSGDLHMLSMGSYASGIRTPQTGLSSDMLGYIPKISGITDPNGGTCAACGLEDAMTVLASATKQSKVVVLMTDGSFNRSTSSLNPNDDARKFCTGMKNMGANLWTISFGRSANGVMVDCASSPDQAKEAHNREELMNFFRNIATTVGKIRINK